jgi:hypothetical protein
VHEALGAALRGGEVLAEELGVGHAGACCDTSVHLCKYYRTNRLRGQGSSGTGPYPPVWGNSRGTRKAAALAG